MVTWQSQNVHFIDIHWLHLHYSTEKVIRKGLHNQKSSFSDCFNHFFNHIIIYFGYLCAIMRLQGGYI